MRVFISWSGRRSKALATVLHGWIRRMLPTSEPWMSEQIPPGNEWRPKLIDQLTAAHAAIVCITPENPHSQWLFFETGAAAAKTDCVFPVLLHEMLPPPPVAGLQVTRCWDKASMRMLVETLNREPPLPTEWLVEQFERLWPELAAQIDEIHRLASDSSWEYYDDAIKEIHKHLRELERTKKVDVITFYVRDYAAPKEAVDYYIEVTLGLRDPAPMYGPVVYDDFRKNAEPESFVETLHGKLAAASQKTIGNRATTFIAREEVLAAATFRDFDETDRALKALLHLNWRSSQQFSEDRREALREHAATVFKLLPSRPSISLERSRMLTKELRAHRYLGASELPGTSPAEQHTLIRGALAQFFEPDGDDVKIEIISIENGGARKWCENIGNEGIACALGSDWQWVQGTTKPLFLRTDGEPTAIIVPMRIPPGLDTCKSIIAITERVSGLTTLKKEMVRPLCSLADTFGGMSRVCP